MSDLRSAEHALLLLSKNCQSINRLPLAQNLFYKIITVQYEVIIQINNIIIILYLKVRVVGDNYVGLPQNEEIN